jgi:hypothetical protein
MNKVYVITRGEYSDYRIMGVFKDLKKAKEFCKLSYEYMLEEYDLLDDKEYIDDYIKRQRSIYWVKMNRSGNVISIFESDYIDLEDGISIYKEYDKCLVIGGCVMAKDEKHAIKIMNEKRAKAIAMGKFDE